MRIAMVTPGSIDSRSGGYLYDRRMKWHLIKNGDLVKRYPLDKYGGNHSKLVGEIQGFEPDILIQDEMGFKELKLLNDGMRQSTDVVIIAIIHNPFSMIVPSRSRSGTIDLERSFISTVDGIIANSRTTLDDFERICGIRKRSMVVNPGRNNLDLSIEGTFRKERSVQIIAVGNLTPNKGYIDMVRSLSLIRERDWTLTIAGEAPKNTDHLEKLKGAMEKYGLQNRIELAGHLYPKDLGMLYNTADIFLSTSYYEGWGMANVEAMGHSIPVITTSRGAPSEYLDDEINGYLVDPSDNEMIAFRIKTLISDSKFRRMIGKAGKRRFDQLPTWGESMDKAREFLLTFTS